MRKILVGVFLMLFTVFAFAALRQVEAKYVCMMNNSLFDRVQIPVEVEGKTYYGCCAGCKNSLKVDASIRAATDPVSGNKVDKATAVIGANEQGKVWYFENIDNMNSFEE